MISRILLACLALSLVLLSCDGPKPQQHTQEVTDKHAVTKPELLDHRPLFHFTPDSMWMNDPNGMFYKDGIYHLFFQHYPHGNTWGPMHWGHATSRDLVRWEQQPIALYPDEKGMIFSGSAVVDHQNTSGISQNGEAPIVALFTQHDSLEVQKQSIAWSLDGGKSFTVNPNNPVIPNPGIKDFRDPKVTWYAPEEKWVMVFSGGDRVKIYDSKDLKDWTFVGDWGMEFGSHEGVWECPDLFPLNTPSGETKWVMLVSLNNGSPNGGSGTQYFIGDFDGKKFTPESTQDQVNWLDYGRDNYAGVTWDNIGGLEERTFLGWMSNWNYATVVPTERWRSAMTIPCRMTIQHDGSVHYLSILPREEMREAFQFREDLKSSGFKYHQDSTEYLAGIYCGKLKIGASSVWRWSNDAGDRLDLSFDASAGEVLLDRSHSGKTDFHENFAEVQRAPLPDGCSTITVVQDRSSLEVFLEDGRVILSSIFFPTTDFDRFEVIDGKQAVEELTFDHGMQ